MRQVIDVKCLSQISWFPLQLLTKRTQHVTNIE